MILGLFELVLLLSLPALLVVFALRQRISAAPSQLLLVCGRRGLSDRGYALVRGATLVLPLLEAAELVSLEPFALRIARRLRTRAGAEVDVEIAATIVYPERAEDLLETFERAPTPRVALAELAEDAIAGSAAHVVATIEPEQLEKDSETIGRAIAAEAEPGVEALGLELQSLTIIPSRGAPFAE